MEIQINPRWIKGNWQGGWRLDLHTISSQYNPDGTFDTQRTQLGELLYQLKYHQDRTQIKPIANLTANFIKDQIKAYPYLAGIVPIPPSNLERPFQPVLEVATEIGAILNLVAPLDYLTKTRPTNPIKNSDSSESRKEELRDALQVKDGRFQGKFVLLFDDLYRSGETLNAATEILYNEGGVRKVFVVVLTQTRIKK